MIIPMISNEIFVNSSSIGDLDSQIKALEYRLDFAKSIGNNTAAELIEKELSSLKELNAEELESGEEESSGDDRPFTFQGRNRCSIIGCESQAQNTCNGCDENFCSAHWVGNDEDVYGCNRHPAINIRGERQPNIDDSGRLVAYGGNNEINLYDRAEAPEEMLDSNPYHWSQTDEWRQMQFSPLVRYEMVDQNLSIISDRPMPGQPGVYICNFRGQKLVLVVNEDVDMMLDTDILERESRGSILGYGEIIRADHKIFRADDPRVYSELEEHPFYWQIRDGDIGMSPAANVTIRLRPMPLGQDLPVGIVSLDPKPYEEGTYILDYYGIEIMMYSRLVGHELIHEMVMRREVQ